MNYFSLFGLPICYQINIQELSSRFQDLQRQYHPDKFVRGSREEQLAAMRKSSAINQAWQTLRDPLNRAEYLLSLYGFNVDNKRHVVHDKSFLTEQISLHEELNKIEKTQNKIQLETFIKREKKIFNSYYQNMVTELNNKEWENAINTVCKLRFLDKLNKLVEQLEEKLFQL